MKKIIKFWDNEDYDYPLMECDSKDLGKIESYLKKYQQKDYYNFDDFIQNLIKRKIKVKLIIPNREWFF